MPPQTDVVSAVRCGAVRCGVVWPHRMAPWTHEGERYEVNDIDPHEEDRMLMKGALGP